MAPALLPNGNQGLAVNAKAHVFAVNTITSTIEKCSFCRAKSGIRGREQVGASVGYSNVITVRDCMFIETPIAICNPGQSWMIESNTFEGLAQSATDYLHTAVGDDLTVAGTGLLTIRNNWCGDAFGDQVWIKLLAPVYTIIEGNLFSGGVRGIQFVPPAPGHGVAGGVSIRNNEFSSGTPSAVGSAIDLGVGITWNGLEISGNNLASGAAPIANLPVRHSISIFSNIFDRGHPLPFPDPSFNGQPGTGYLRLTSTMTTGPLLSGDQHRYIHRAQRAASGHHCRPPRYHELCDGTRIHIQAIRWLHARGHHLGDHRPGHRRLGVDESHVAERRCDPRSRGHRGWLARQVPNVSRRRKPRSWIMATDYHVEGRSSVTVSCGYRCDEKVANKRLSVGMPTLLKQIKGASTSPVTTQMFSSWQ